MAKKMFKFTLEIRENPKFKLYQQLVDFGDVPEDWENDPVFQKMILDYMDGMLTDKIRVTVDEVSLDTKLDNLPKIVLIKNEKV
jgi:hypothetical protein